MLGTEKYNVPSLRELTVQRGNWIITQINIKCNTVINPVERRYAGTTKGEKEKC